MTVAIDCLLGLGVAAQWVCALGVLVMRGPFDKLHYSGAGGTMGPLLVAVAAFLRLGWTAGGLQTIVLLAFVVLASPATTMALARAARRAGEGAP